MDYESGLRMARWMTDEDGTIKKAIAKCQADNYGVVSLRFTDDCRYMEVEILLEPYEDSVRVYRGED